jgi:hypothetical protein
LFFLQMESYLEILNKENLVIVIYNVP